MLCVVLLNSISCAKKKYPESIIENQPVYYSKFDINGVPMEFKAGENEVYMYADVTKDTADVNEYNSTLRRSNCNGCGPSLKFVLRDYKATSGSETSKIDSTVRVGRYEYLKNIQGPVYKASYKATQNGNGSVLSFNWNFEDGTSLTGTNVSYEFQNPGTSKVCVSLKTANGCVSNLCHDELIGRNTLNCEVSARADTSSSVDFATSVSGGTAPYKYYWEFGDGTNLQGNAEVTHYYPYSGSYLAQVTVVDATGVRTITQYNVVTKHDISSCAVNFSRTSLSEISAIQQSLSKVRIVYTNEQGVSYQSLGKEQPANSNFEILNVQDGETNENGRPTKIVNIRFNCEVYNAAEKLTISNGFSTISIAY